MTKAERIFKATCFECKKAHRVWGYQINPDGNPVSFNHVICDDNESVCNRTLNAIEKEVVKARKANALALKYGIIPAREHTARDEILNMVEQTIKNTRKNLA